MKKSLVLFVAVAFLGFGLTSCNQDKSADSSTAEASKTETKAETPAGEAAEEVDNTPKTTIEFESTVVDFGDIQQGDKVSDIFKFTNTGDEPLIISSAKGSCGCTVPEWPKEPIAPGESAELKVEYASKGKKGKQTKTVTVQANTDPNPTRLTVKANVIVPEGAEDQSASAAPAIKAAPAAK